VISNDSGNSYTSRSKQHQAAAAEDGANPANMMFVVVRNLKSQKLPEDQLNE